MANSLGLAADGDEVELVREVEKAFEITIDKAEAEGLRNAGQLCDLILRKIPPHDTDRKSALAMTYYRLARALRNHGGDKKLTPESDLYFLEKQGVTRAFRALETASELRLPGAAMSWLGTLGYGLSLAAFLVGCFLAGLFGIDPRQIGICLLAFLSGLAMAWLDPGKLPDGCTTLGGLARRTTPLNFGHLAHLGARHRDADIWNNLLELLSDYGVPKNEITRETLILRAAPQ